MAEVDNTGQDDFAKVQGFIKEQVQTYFNELAEQTAQQTQQQPNQQQQAQKQAGDFVRSIINDDLNEAKLTAADAKDEVRFYRNNPDALDYEAEIEKTFTDAVKVGRPLPRQDILDWIRGREYRTAPDKFKERETARTKQQLAHAEDATDIGTAALNKAKNDTTWTNFADLPLEEMEKALDGVVF
jgi:hypothetical protein